MFTRFYLFRSKILSVIQVIHLIVFLFCFLCFCSNAQDQNIRWLNVSNEFPSTAIDAIEQDESGNILFANHLGVFSFDGLHYTNLTNEDGLANSSSDGLYKDPFGRIWVSAYSEKISFIENGKVKPFNSYNESEYFDGASARVFCLAENLVVIDKLSSGIQLYYRKMNHTWKLVRKRTFNPEKRLAILLPGNRTDQVAWLYQKDPTHHTNFTLEVGKHQRTFNITSEQSFSRLIVNETLFISIGNWLFRIQHGKISSKNFSKTLGAIFKGNDGSIWLSFRDGGVQQLSASTLTARGEPVVSSLQFVHFLQDQEGNIWFNAGKSKSGMIPFSPYNKWETGNSIEGNLNTVFALNDTLFLGHINGDVGYLIPGKRNKELVIYRMEQDAKLSPSNIRDFIVFKGQIYFCSQDHGLFRIDRKSFRVEHVLKGIRISGIYNSGELLYLATSIGLIQYDGKIQKQLLKKTNISAVTITSEGKILFGTLDGLYEYSNGAGKRVKWPVPTDERIPFFAQSKETLVVGTYGLGLIIKKGTTFSTIRQKDGLPSDFVNSMLFDSKGRLIVTTGNGIALISFDSSKKKGFVIQQIAGNECLNHDTYNSTELKNTLFFSSNNGLLEVSNVYSSKLGNPLVLKQIILNGEVLTDTLISFVYNSSNQLVLFYRQNNFTSNKNTMYFYRLKDDQPWIKTTNESILLKELRPGNYTFEIYAYNPSNGFRSSIISQNIHVIPQFYQRVWVQVLFFISIILKFFFIIRFIIKSRNKKRKKALEYQLEVSRLEARALRSQMNPHFIFNSLNSIQSFILKNDRDSAYKFLGKFSVLIREILEHSRSEKISIEDEVRMLSNYLDLEKMRANNSFEYTIEVDRQIVPHKFDIPIMLLQPIIENAVVHGVLPLEDRKGHISIAFQLMANDLEITIRDNGIGRKASMELNLRKDHYHQSFGVDISKERVNQIRPDQDDSQFEIIDLVDVSGQAIGTEVKITLKIEQ